MKTDVDKLKSFLKQAAPIIETYGNKSLISEIEKAVTATEDSATVLFCGEFKRGKSSLVNAIVGMQLCPTDIGIATSVVTVVRYGTVKKAVRYYGNLLEEADSLKSEEIEWDDIKKYTVGDVLDINNTILVELSYPSPFLKSGITIIDTPGLGGLDPRHAVLTHAALPKADIIVFVTDTCEPLTESELEFYKDKVFLCGKRNVVLVNKSDLLSSGTLTAHLGNTRWQLAKLGSPEVIPVSAKCWELYTKLEDKDFLLSSNRDAVLAAITSEVENFRKCQYRRYRDMTIAELEEASGVISLEIQQLNKDSDDKLKALEDLQRRQAALGKFRSDLNNPTSPVRLQINTIFEDARNEVQNLISHEGTILTSTEFDALLQNEKSLDNDGKWLVAQINSRLQKLSGKIDSRIECAFEEISQKIEKKVSDVVEAEKFVVSNGNKMNVINSQLVFSTIGKATMGITIGGVAMWAVGSLIPVLGLIAGVATAAVLIWRGVSREVREKKMILLRQQILPKINLAITDMRNQVGTRFSKFQQSILQALQTIIEETEDKMKALQVSIQESRASEHQGKEKIAELEQKVKFCETLTTQMRLLYSNPFSDAQ